jgi:hypothetical protein
VNGGVTEPNKPALIKYARSLDRIYGRLSPEGIPFTNKGYNTLTQGLEVFDPKEQATQPINDEDLYAAIEEAFTDSGVLSDETGTNPELYETVNLVGAFKPTNQEVPAIRRSLTRALQEEPASVTRAVAASDMCALSKILRDYSMSLPESQIAQINGFITRIGCGSQ